MTYNQEPEDMRECEGMRKMFVGGLNRETTEETFFNYFGNFGNMVDKVIIRDMETKQSRGFGFITYDRSDCVEAVLQSKPHEIDGKTTDVKRAMPRDYNTSTAHSKVTKLFIGGIPQDLTPEELQQYIESRHPVTIGSVDNIDFFKNEANLNRGFGFLECTSTDFADRLSISEASFVLKGKAMALKKAEDKGGNTGGPRGGQRGGRGGNRGFRGASRGRGGNRGGYNQRGGYNGAQNYNNQSTGYPNNSYNNSGDNSYGNYNQGGGYDQGQQYNQRGGYNQSGYNNNNSNYYGNGGNQGNFGGGSAQGGWNAGGNNRYAPY